MRPPASLGLAVATVLSLTAPVEATHAVDHRYLVLGYVTDAKGKPLPPAVIRVVREKTGLSYAAETDTAGFYVVVVHLHDEDLLDRLLVGAGTTTIRVEAQFEPGNGTDPRAAFLSTLEKYLGR